MGNRNMVKHTQPTDGVLRLQILQPGSAKPLLDVFILDTQLTFQTKPSSSALAACPPGCTVTLSGKKIPTMIWTAETFGDSLKRTIDDRNQVCEIQFRQRCLMSSSGYATWRLRL